MTVLEGLKGALLSLKSNKLRAGLTMLGIIIGIAAVIAVVTIGLGGKAAVMQEMEKTGVNLFIIYPKTVARGEPGQTVRLDLNDAEFLKRTLPQLQYMVPTSIEYASVKVSQQSESAVVIGTTPDFAELRRREVSAGRFFSQEEYQSQRRVAVIDQNTAESLFKAGNPLGQTLMVNQVPCRVIGVLAKDESAFSQFNVGPQNMYLYLPLGTWSQVFNSRRIDQLEGSTYRDTELESTITTVKRLLNMRYGISDRFEVFNVQQLVQAANQITKILTIIIGFVAGISLVVGGIGIMNIMLVSVTERTREIGLRKALGARERDVLIQFLLEAVVLSLMGGIIGIALGAGSASLITRLLKWPPLLSGWAVVLAVTFSVGVGLFFGYYPAHKAAELEPIVALRYE